MKQLELSSGKVALIDDDDYERCSQFKWCAIHGRRDTWYAMRHDYSVTPCKGIYLHRFILNPPDNLAVDHINHNGLDCQRNNLRMCTDSENSFNGRKREGCNAPYKGVRLEYGYYVARITKGEKRIMLGRFAKAKYAAFAYDEAARNIHSEFACLNFPFEHHSSEEIEQMKKSRTYKPETKPIWTRLPPDLLDWVKQQRDGNTPSVSAVIKRCIEEVRAAHD